MQLYKIYFICKLLYMFRVVCPPIIRNTNNCIYSIWRGPGSSVGIEIDYWLDGPGSNPGGDEIFRLSRPALGPTQPIVKWVQDLSRG